MAVDSSFLGTGWSFPPSFDIHDRSTSLASGEEDIEQSLAILLSTKPNERLMHPTYGCAIHAMVFENTDESTLTRIRDAVRRAVLFFEPRIDLDAIEVDQSAAFEGLLRIMLSYRIRETNSRSNMVFPFYFLEGTNVG